MGAETDGDGQDIAACPFPSVPAAAQELLSGTLADKMMLEMSGAIESWRRQEALQKFEKIKALDQRPARRDLAGDPKACKWSLY